MKENKKLETSDTEVVAEISIQNKSEEALPQKIQMETKQFFKNYMYVRKNMTYKGEEIPKDVPFTEYSSYIMRNMTIKYYFQPVIQPVYLHPYCGLHLQ